MKASGTVPGSFRDPSGFLFYHEGHIYRRVEMVYQKHYDKLIGSGCYDELVEAGLLIPHQEVEIKAQESVAAYKVIQPEQIQFVSYPYEWSFSQLKDAALTTLEIQKRALEYGMSLKDCSAYNVQFRECKPTLIDTLSFETYREGEPWTAYRQFCQHFLAPLALMSHKDVRLNQLLRVYIDGIPLDLASSLLPTRTRLNFALLAHIHLHAKSQKRFAAISTPNTSRTMNRMAFLGLVDSLERIVKKLRWQPQGTEWLGYAEDTSYSSRALQHKADLVSSFLDLTNSEIVWDLGANIGLYSRLAAAKGYVVVSADVDPACVEVNYLRCCQEHEIGILPLVLDLTNPSPGLGWGSEERMALVERGPADTVLALALLHHLAISNNLPFARIAGFFSQICVWLIIEFIPKSDSQLQKLLRSRQDIFQSHTQQDFEGQFAEHFTILESAKIEDSDRTLYLMQRKANST